MRIIRTATLTAALILQFSLITSASTFTDVEESSSYYIAVESLAKLGVVQGYEDGSFKPDASVNRAEAIKMVLASGGIAVNGGLYATGFSDVPIDSWYAGYVMSGLTKGIISGNPDGTFAAARQVNKAEFIKMTLKTFEINLSNHTNLQTDLAADTPANEWYSSYISYAKTVGLIFPDLQNNLYPAQFLNRGQCAQIIYKMYLLKQGGEAQKMLSIAEAKLVEALVRIHNDEITSAMYLADEALNFSQQALTADPDSTATQATEVVAKSFQKLFAAYKAGLNQDSASVTTLVQEAKNLATQATKINSSADYFSQKIHQQGDQLLSQL